MSRGAETLSQTGLGLLLQNLRERRGLKLRELAQLANVDHAYIYRLETGAKESPSEEVLVKLIRGSAAGSREAAMLRYLAEHPATPIGLVEVAIADEGVSYGVFAAAAGAVYRGPVRQDFRRVVDRVRRVLEDDQ